MGLFVWEPLAQPHLPGCVVPAHKVGPLFTDGGFSVPGDHQQETLTGEALHVNCGLLGWAGSWARRGEGGLPLMLPPQARCAACA